LTKLVIKKKKLQLVGLVIIDAGPDTDDYGSPSKSNTDGEKKTTIFVHLVFIIQF
jgi:hypothetical protein